MLHSTKWKRLLLTIGLLGGPIAGCSEVSQEEPENVGDSAEQLYGLGNAAEAWPLTLSTLSHEVKVCMGAADFPTAWRDEVRNILSQTWAKYANVTFTGWDACLNAGYANVDHVIVTFVPPTVGADGKIVEYRGGTAPVGAFLNVSVQLMNRQVTDSSSLDRFRYEVIHEFGHALGFFHEQQREDNFVNGTPIQCPGTEVVNYQPIYSGQHLSSAYDEDSIMNYCNPLLLNGMYPQRLSPLDVAGVGVAYGARPAAEQEEGITAQWTPYGNALYVMKKTADGHTVEAHWVPGTSFSNWFDLGVGSVNGLTLGRPALAWAPNNQQMFFYIRGTDNQIYGRFWDLSGYSPDWGAPGSNLTSLLLPLDARSSPAAAWTATGNQLSISVRGANNHLYEKTWTSAGFTNWVDISGGFQMTSSPSVAPMNWGETRYFLARGTDNQLYGMYGTPGSYSAFSSLGGNLTAAPASVWSADGDYYIAVRGTDNQYYYKYWKAATGYVPSVTGWLGVGAAPSGLTFTSAPTITWRSNTHELWVLGVATDGNIYAKYMSSSGAWTGWSLMVIQ